MSTSLQTLNSLSKGSTVYFAVVQNCFETYYAERGGSPTCMASFTKSHYVIGILEVPPGKQPRGKKAQIPTWTFSIPALGSELWEFNISEMEGITISLFNTSHITRQKRSAPFFRNVNGDIYQYTYEGKPINIKHYMNGTHTSDLLGTTATRVRPI